MVVLGFILAQALTAPEPSASPLKTITHVTARPVCAILHDIVLPFTVVEKQNNESLRTIGKELAESRSWPTDPTEGNGTINGAKLIASGRMRQQSGDMFDAFAEIEKRLAASYHALPVGKDPKADELRARVDNVVKLQYARAEQYDQLAFEVQGHIVDPESNALIAAYFKGPFIGNPPSSGVPDFNAPQVDDPTPGPFLHSQTPTDSPAQLDVRSLLDLPAAYVDEGMKIQEAALVQPELDAVNTCDPRGQEP